MVTRLHLFILVTLSILLTSIVLILYTQQRESEFKDHQLATQKAMVEGASRDINYRLENQIQHVRLFNDEYRQLISHLALHPHDEATREIIDIRLRQRFSNIDSFTITNSLGMPILDDIEARVGDICKRDVTNFSAEHKRLHNTDEARNAIFIHPQAEHYHYDIMAIVKDGTPYRNVFLVSFTAEPIQHILKTREIPGHHLMLTRLNDSTLIEISDSGTRDTMGRNGRLSEEELRTIKVSKEIPNTDWVLIDLKDPSFEKSYIKKLWKEAGGIMLIVAFTNLMIFMIFSTRIKYAEIRENKRENKTYPWIKHKHVA